MKHILTPILLLLAVSCSSTPTDDGSGPTELAPPSIMGPERELSNDVRTGQTIFDCDTHLRTWIQAMGKPRTKNNQETITFTTVSLTRLVNKQMDVLVQEAVSGPARNRAIASAALGFSNDPEVLPLLVNNAVDDDPFVASKALLGIGVMASPDTPTSTFYQAVQREDRTEELTRNLAFALFQVAEVVREDINGSMAPVLISLLDDADPGVRWQSVMALGLIKAPIAIPPITDLLAGDPSDEVRSASAWSLGKIGSIGSSSALIRALEDSDKIVAGAARAALKRIHGRDNGPAPDDWDVLGSP